MGTKRDPSYFCIFQSPLRVSLDWPDPSGSSGNNNNNNNNNTHKLYSGALDHDNSKGTANLQWYGKSGEFISASDELSCGKFTITL